MCVRAYRCTFFVLTVTVFVNEHACVYNRSVMQTQNNLYLFISQKYL